MYFSFRILKCSFYLTLTFLFIIQFPPLKAQNYIPLVDSNKVWYVFRSGMAPQFRETLIYKFSGDSTYEGKKYFVVYNTLDTTQFNWNPCGLIREDSTRKIFYKESTSAQEELIYDFNAKIGDTLFIPPDLSNIPIVVYNIDTFELGGVTRKRYEIFRIDSGDDIWIEGIGSLLGILNSKWVGTTGVYMTLLCYYENGELIYTNPEFDSCYYASTDIQNNRLTNMIVEIHPSPITNISVLKLKSSYSSKYTIDIFTINGIKMNSIDIPESGEMRISAKDYKTGLYIFTIKTQHRTVFTGKFIILNEN